MCYITELLENNRFPVPLELKLFVARKDAQRISKAKHRKTEVYEGRRSKALTRKLQLQGEDMMNANLF